MMILIGMNEILKIYENLYSLSLSLSKKISLDVVKIDD